MKYSRADDLDDELQQSNWLYFNFDRFLYYNLSEGMHIMWVFLSDCMTDLQMCFQSLTQGGATAPSQVVSTFGSKSLA